MSSHIPWSGTLCFCCVFTLSCQPRWASSAAPRAALGDAVRALCPARGRGECWVRQGHVASGIHLARLSDAAGPGPRTSAARCVSRATQAAVSVARGAARRDRAPPPARSLARGWGIGCGCRVVVVEPGEFRPFKSAAVVLMARVQRTDHPKVRARLCDPIEPRSASRPRRRRRRRCSYWGRRQSCRGSSRRRNNQS
jgi:hypothetical protein